MESMDPVSVGQAIRALRMQKRVGLRELCRNAEISPATLSAIEGGHSSPTLATMHRILRVLGTDFATFFTNNTGPADSPVFRADQMTQISDGQRQCTFLFPRRANIRFTMARETQPALEQEAEWEEHDCDLGGVVIEGGPLEIEVAGQKTWRLSKGDSFYIPAGTRHRGRNIGRRTLHLVTTYDPPRY